jgi:hypothetical protein
MPQALNLSLASLASLRRASLALVSGMQQVPALALEPSHGLCSWFVAGLASSLTSLNFVQ